jgi:hypothetical protein
VARSATRENLKTEFLLPSQKADSERSFFRFLHKLSPFEGVNILSGEGKPLAFGVLGSKALMPIVLYSVCIVCLDGMDQLEIIRELQRYLIGPALHKDGLAIL